MSKRLSSCTKNFLITVYKAIKFAKEIYATSELPPIGGSRKPQLLDYETKVLKVQNRILNFALRTEIMSLVSCSSYWAALDVWIKITWH